MFKTKLKVEKVKDNVYILKEPLIYESAKYGTIKVGTDFATDFATVPKWLHWLFKPQSKGYSKSSVLHDYLYSERKYNKFKADFVFLEAMKEEQKGLPNKLKWWATRWTLFSAVFVFGMFFKKGRIV